MASRDYMGIAREKIPRFPTINSEACTSCGSCLDFCGNGVFAQGDTATLVANPYNCVVGCSWCRSTCPVEAISFPRKEDLIGLLRRLRGERDAASQAAGK